jgi:nitrite reductase/ring-hydroxylating ferredoxin subunit
MVGFVQNAIIEALIQELDEFNKDLEYRAIKAWNKVCIILLEMLSRAYREEAGSDRLQELLPINKEEILEMSVESYEKSVGIHRKYEYENIFVAFESELPEGERKIIEANGISIGIFHHKGSWYAIRNSCLHRGGPVATGKLVDDNIICPWHGYTYDLTNGRLLMDPSARLDMYEVILDEGKIFVRVPETHKFQDNRSEGKLPMPGVNIEEIPVEKLNENEFNLQDIPPGSMRLVHFNSVRVAVYNVGGKFYATSEECTHAGGPLSEGILKENEVRCPWHDSCFNVITGAVTCPPADEPLETYQVIISGVIGRIQLAS